MNLTNSYKRISQHTCFMLTISHIGTSRDVDYLAISATSTFTERQCCKLTVNWTWKHLKCPLELTSTTTEVKCSHAICSEFHCSLYGSLIRVCQCLSEPEHDLFVCFYCTGPTIKLRNCENDSVVVFPTYVSCWSVTLEKWKKDATQCLCCDWRAVIIIHLAAASDNVEVMYSHWRRRSVALPASSSSSSSPTSSSLGTVENHENTEAVFFVFFVSCRVFRIFLQLPCFAVFFAILLTF